MRSFVKRAQHVSKCDCCGMPIYKGEAIRHDNQGDAIHLNCKASEAGKVTSDPVFFELFRQALGDVQREASRG